MKCVSDVIPFFRTILSEMTGIKKDWIINGESIRGAELVKVVNGQKVPFSPDDNFIVFYLTYDNSLEITQVIDNEQSIQSYVLNLIVYGKETRKNTIKIKNKMYDPAYLDRLATNDIGIMKFSNTTDINDFMGGGTYILRSDLEILFNVVIEDDREEETIIDNGGVGLSENNI